MAGVDEVDRGNSPTDTLCADTDGPICLMMVPEGSTHGVFIHTEGSDPT